MFLLLCLLVMILPAVIFWHRSLRGSATTFARLAILFFFVSVLGAVVQIPWSTLIYGRFYVSADYVFGYLPFMPVTQAEIDRPFGDSVGALNDISITWLIIIWAAFTLPVWIGAIWLRNQVWRRIIVQTPR